MCKNVNTTQRRVKSTSFSPQDVSMKFHWKFKYFFVWKSFENCRCCESPIFQNIAWYAKKSIERSMSPKNCLKTRKKWVFFRMYAFLCTQKLSKLCNQPLGPAVYMITGNVTRIIGLKICIQVFLIDTSLEFEDRQNSWTISHVKAKNVTFSIVSYAKIKLF